MSLTLDTARTVISGARAKGREAGLKPLTVVVLDAGGHVVAVEREDGASNKRFEIAFGKAHGALSLGMGSRALMERAEQQPYFIAAVTNAVGGSLVPVPGGVLVKDAEGALDFVNTFLQEIIDSGTWKSLWTATIGEVIDGEAPEPPTPGDLPA